MVQEAEEFHADDEKQRDRITAKNALESRCFNIKQKMEDEKAGINQTLIFIESLFLSQNEIHFLVERKEFASKCERCEETQRKAKKQMRRNPEMA